MSSNPDTLDGTLPVRVIKDGEGTVLQRFDYYPFGSESRVWTAGTNTPQSALRYRFGGKEIAGQKVSVSTDDNYYSLFGSTIPNTKDNSLIISLFSNIDELLKRYAHVLTYSSSNPLNQEEPSTKTDFSTSRVSRPFSFEYTGAMFSSTKDGTIIHPISSASLNGKTITGDPFLVIDNFVTQGQINNGSIGIGLYGKQWKNSYWITARSNSVRSTPLQIRFDYTNAQGFIHSFNSIFGTDIKLPE